MIGLVVVTHGRLAEELLAATEHVVGPLDHAQALCIEADDDMERRQADIKAAVETVDQGDGAVILTDMFGGTPANLSITLLRRGKLEVVSGVNLPMLIKIAEARETMSVEGAATAAVEAGRKYIAVASKVLDRNRA
jgi:PTS system mannose-specific IIA component